MRRRRAREARPQPLKPAPLRRGRRPRFRETELQPAADFASAGGSSARPRPERRSSAGAVATSAPPNQRRRRPVSPSSPRRRPTLQNLVTPPLCARSRVGYHSPHDAGRNKSAAALSRRADARARQARGRRRPPRPERRRQASRTISTRCASACRAIRRSPIGSTATPPAAWCSDAITRRWRSWGCCSSRARSARPIGRSSPARPRARRARSTCRSAGSTTSAAGG